MPSQIILLWSHRKLVWPTLEAQRGWLPAERLRLRVSQSLESNSMVMIGPDELAELDQRLQSLFQTLIQNKKTNEADKQAARRFLEWAIYPDWDAGKPELDVRPIQWSDGLHPTVRDRLVDVARSAAAVVRAGKDRDKSDLI